MANTKLPARLLDTSAIPALNVTGDLTVDTTTLKVDSTNNRVGIGIASPGHLLDILKTSTGDATVNIKSTTGGDPTLIFNSAAANRSGLIKYQDNGTNVGRIQYVHNGDRIDFQAGSATGATMSVVNGKVGIGETSPTHNLNVVGTSGTAVVQSIRNPNTSWSQYALTRYGTEAADVRYMDFGYYRGSAEAGRGLVVKSQANATLVTFLDSGNVGIGTEAPAQALEIFRNSNSGSAGGYAGISLRNDHSDGYMACQFHEGGTLRGDILFQNGVDDMQFRVGGGGAERMRITDTGNVGIGTQAPNSRLHVKSSGTGNVLYVESSDGQHLGGFYQEADTRAAFNVRGATGSVEINLDSGGNSWFTGGKLGVGTAAPNLKLHVEENTDTWVGEFKNVRSAGGYGLRIDNSGAGGATDTRYALGVYTPGGTGFFIRNNGTAVLGATVPDGQLHIKGATNKTLKIDGTHSSGEFTSVSFARNGTDKWRIFQKADDSRLSFYSDGASAHQLSLHSNGHVTKPKNCAFRAYTQTDWTTNGEITSGWNDTAFSGDGRCYDVNNNFNPSNGRFTAPVAGIYLFTVMWDSNGSQGGLSMMKNSTSATLVAWEPTGRTDNAWESRAYSTMVQLAANDFITLKAVHASGSYPVHMGNAQWGHFSGCLIS